MRWILGAIALLAALTSWLWFSPLSLTLSDTGAEWTCTSLASGAPQDVGLLPAQDESTHAMIVKWIVATGTDQSSAWS